MKRNREIRKRVTAHTKSSSKYTERSRWIRRLFLSFIFARVRRRVDYFMLLPVVSLSVVWPVPRTVSTRHSFFSFHQFFRRPYDAFRFRFLTRHSYRIQTTYPTSFLYFKYKFSFPRRTNHVFYTYIWPIFYFVHYVFHSDFTLTIF